MQDAGIDPKELEHIVFIGEQVLYSQLRDKVAKALNIRQVEKFIDPLTAVARGAAIHAESVNVSTIRQKDSIKVTSTLEDKIKAKWPLIMREFSAKAPKGYQALTSFKVLGVENAVMNLQFQSEKEIQRFRDKSAELPIYELLRNCVYSHTRVKVQFRAMTWRKWQEYNKTQIR
jgi:molecular chaperone DnaK (HSP70)